MEKKQKYPARFDWVLKRLLRNEASSVVQEGFLSVLLRENNTYTQQHHRLQRQPAKKHRQIQ
jgi:hypothetical protein